MREKWLLQSCSSTRADSGGLLPPIMENQIEKKMENDMETVSIGSSGGLLDMRRVIEYFCFLFDC